MSVQKVKEYLKKWDMEDRIMEFPVSSATVEEAAIAVGCKEAEIAKTMSFKVGETPVLIVTAGDRKIDNAKYKAFFHKKTLMLKREELEFLIGHPAGGICPFGVKDGVIVYLDESLKRFDHVYPACGSENSAIKLTISELEKYSNYEQWIDVCKNRI